MTSPDDPYAPPPGYGPPPGFEQPGYGPPAGWREPPGYGARPSYQSPPPWPGGPPRTNTKAVVALALAISAYLPVVPFVGAVVALFLVGPARREIYASQGHETGLGLCTAAKVVAVVHLVFVALLALLFVGVVALGFGVGFS
jgi:hypothetical protein